MNNPRREQLRKALELLGQARDIIESCCEEEQDAFDNMPEGLQYSERGEHMEECISNMEDAISSIEDISTTLDEEVIGGY